MSPRSTIPTISTVADRVGVSKATVSRVLRGGNGIGDSTIQKVQQAIVELGYRPSKVASQLAMGGRGRAKSYVVECVWFFPPRNKLVDIILRSDNERATFASIWDAVSKKGYSVIADFVDAGSAEPKLPTLMGRNVADGLIVVGSVPPGWLAQASGVMPTVSLQQFSPLRQDVPAVNCDYRAGVHRAVQHLVSHGHRQIAFFCIADPIDVHREMIHGYEQGMSELGIERVGGLLAAPHRAADQSLEDVCRLELDRWWAMPQRPTAIMATEVYLGPILRLLQERGVRVPQDVSLFSLASGTEAGRPTDPFFSRLEHPHREMAVVAVNQLLARIDGHDGPGEVTLLPMGFTESASVAAPPR
jgi:DNA-binding LacI/PurR family transcriptional regulator